MADVLQVLRRTGAKRTATFYSDGTATDSSTPVTVDVIAPDGTVLFDDAATTDEAGTGVYGYQLAAQAECTLLRLDWTGTINSVVQTVTNWVEWVGAVLFTIPEAKTFDRGAIVATSNTPAVTDADIHATRTQITDDFADILGFQPIPRFRRVTLDGTGTSTLILPDLKTHRLLSVTIGGVAQTVGDYTLHPHGVLDATADYALSGTFTAGRRNVIVEYVCGDERVDPATSRAALIVARTQLVHSDVSDRATSISTDMGVVSYSTAGRSTFRGDMQWYGLPLVDSVLNRRSQRAVAVA